MTDKTTNTTDTDTTDTRIDLPSASDLDTGGTSQGYSLALYLIPADEHGGIPCVTTHEGVGNIGTPAHAYHGRWYHLATYGEDVSGESVLAALRERVDALIAISNTYLGSDWDGRNVVGRWADDDGDTYHDSYGAAFCAHTFSESLTHYWDASDYLGHGGTTWKELCRYSGIDVERIDDDDAIEAIAAHVTRDAARDDVKLSRVEEAVTSLRDEWIAEYGDERDEDSEASNG